MAQIIPTVTINVNNGSALSGFQQKPQDVVVSITKEHNKLYHHFWYKLLNSGLTKGLFKHKEMAQIAGCSERTIYSFLQEGIKNEEISVENKGRNGVMVTMLKKGWELTKSLKTAFLAYFRDKGLIPYIYTSNTSPPRVGTNQSEDRIGKICRKAGLNEAQTRAIREQLNKISVIRNLGALVNFFIKKLKEGAVKAILSGSEVLYRQSMKEKLQKQAEIEIREDLARIGIVERVPGVGCTIEELDAFREYGAIFGSRLNKRMMELCSENGI
jgi:hypothetical protein